MFFLLFVFCKNMGLYREENTETRKKGNYLKIISYTIENDCFKSDDIFIKPSHKESKIVINWKLISKFFKQEGNLLINVEPIIETTYNDVLIEDPLKVRIKESDITDFIDLKEES